MLVVLVATACQSSVSGINPFLSEYAVGKWSCVFTSTAGAGTSRLTIDAVVSVTSRTSGGVELTIKSPQGIALPSDRGKWSLRDDHLVVQWVRDGLGPVNALPISSHTKQFKVRGDSRDGRGAVRRGNWVGVKVNLEKRTASFAFTLPNKGGPGTLTCRKL